MDLAWKSWDLYTWGAAPSVCSTAKGPQVFKAVFWHSPFSSQKKKFHVLCTGPTSQQRGEGRWEYSLICEYIYFFIKVFRKGWLHQPHSSIPERTWLMRIWEHVKKSFLKGPAAPLSLWAKGTAHQLCKSDTAHQENIIPFSFLFVSQSPCPAPPCFLSFLPLFSLSDAMVMELTRKKSYSSPGFLQHPDVSFASPPPLSPTFPKWVNLCAANPTC